MNTLCGDCCATIPSFQQAFQPLLTGAGGAHFSWSVWTWCEASDLGFMHCCPVGGGVAGARGRPSWGWRCVEPAQCPLLWVTGMLCCIISSCIFHLHLLSMKWFADAVKPACICSRCQQHYQYCLRQQQLVWATTQLGWCITGDICLHFVCIMHQQMYACIAIN